VAGECGSELRARVIDAGLHRLRRDAEDLGDFLLRSLLERKQDERFLQPFGQAIDRDLKRAARITFHPNVNTATLVLAYADFERFLADCGNPVSYITV